MGGVLALALALRVGLMLFQPAELTHDRDAYLGIARQVAEGNGYCSPGSDQPTAFRPPLYPLCLAAVGTLLPWSVAVGLVNMIGAGLLIVGVWKTAEHLELHRWRWLAGLIAAFDPLLVQYAAQPMTESLFTGLVAAWLACVTRPAPDWQSKSLTGFLFGLVCLCRPTLWPLAGLYGLVWIARLIHHRFAASAIAYFPWVTVLSTALVVAPWVARNQLVMGVPLLTTTHGGYTLLLANNPVFYREVVLQPGGAVWSGESLDAWQKEIGSRIHQEIGPGAGEVAEDRLQSRWGRDYIREHPREFVQSVVYRVRSLWRLAPQEPSASGRRLWSLRAVAAFYLVLFLLAAFGLVYVFARRVLESWLPLLLLLVTVQSVHLVYWTDARMRAPLVPVLALLAAHAMAGVVERRTDSEQ